ncbi:MAG: hypothetical protein ABIP78_13495 [Pyrinomonadaceae bacterium]
MSLSEVLEAVRILSPKEQDQVRELLDQIDHSRMGRFRTLRGSAKDESFAVLEIEDFKNERRKIWKGFTE